MVYFDRIDKVMDILRSGIDVITVFRIIFNCDAKSVAG